MSARDWLYARLTGALITPERASAELDAYRAEVLREAAQALRAEHKRIFWATKPETCAEAEFLDRMADQPPARLLACGLCYEEDGEEVHPHPECTDTP